MPRTRAAGTNHDLDKARPFVIERCAGSDASSFEKGEGVVRDRRRMLWLLCIGVVWCGGRPALAADPKPAEVAKRLMAVEEAQRSLAVDLSQLGDQMKQLDEHLGELRQDVDKGHEAAQADRDQLKEMREEVRGLYVEISGIKGDIAQLRSELQSVNGSFGNFRFSSGALIAVLIVLQVIGVALTLRGRG